MPDEMVVDFSHPNRQPIVRPMSDADAAQLAAAQAAAQVVAAADNTRQQQVRTLLTAYVQNPTPTGPETVAALKAVIRVLARDIT